MRLPVQLIKLPPSHEFSQVCPRLPRLDSYPLTRLYFFVSQVSLLPSLFPLILIALSGLSPFTYPHTLIFQPPLALEASRQSLSGYSRPVAHHNHLEVNS
ncbi:hypothetical protein BDR03DRAFT_974939 [Suillus americanus]|nr:hypothetical protein BDR03DRAFT_974939 [Suillus americanus]